MPVTNFSDLTNLGGIADGDKLLAERVDGTTVRVQFDSVLQDGEFSANGLMTRTAAGTYANRTVTGTADKITVTNGDGVSGDPTLTIASTYVGQTSITTLGTITTGTWQGTAIAVNQGGTGQTTYTDGQLLIGNTTGNTLAKATLTGGTGITVTNGSGTITLSTTDEDIQDTVGAMVSGNTETDITVTYNDGTGKLDFSIDDSYLRNNGDTGTGVYDFGGATSFEIPNGAAPTVDAAGEIAIDTTITDYTGLIKYHDGTEELTVVGMPTANLTTTDGHVVAYNATNNEFEMVSAGGVSAATQAEMEAGTSTTVMVTPGRQQYHDSACKGWVAWDGTGTVSIYSSYNTTSITDNGTGDYTVNWATDFSDTNYAATCNCHSTTDTNTNIGATFASSTKAAGTIRVLTGVVNTGAVADEDPVYCSGWGDQ